MLLDAPFEIVGDTGIIGIIVTKQYVDKVLVNLKLKVIKIFGKPALMLRVPQHDSRT